MCDTNPITVNIQALIIYIHVIIILLIVVCIIDYIGIRWINGYISVHSSLTIYPSQVRFKVTYHIKIDPHSELKLRRMTGTATALISGSDRPDWR